MKFFKDPEFPGGAHSAKKVSVGLLSFSVLLSVDVLQNSSFMFFLLFLSKEEEGANRQR